MKFKGLFTNPYFDLQNMHATLPKVSSAIKFVYIAWIIQRLIQKLCTDFKESNLSRLIWFTVSSSMIFGKKFMLLEQLCIHISCLLNCHFYSLLLCKARHCFLSSEDYFFNSSNSILWIDISSLFISCSKWHRKGYTMLSTKDISFVSPSSGVQSISNI